VSSLAVVVVTRNRRTFLLHTLDRLESVAGGHRLVVVDNASEDGTPAAVATRHPGVTLVRLPSNLGAAARNEAVSRLEEPDVAFSDDDSRWAPGALELAAGLLEAEPRLGLVAARVLVNAEGALDPTSGLMAASPLSPPEWLPGASVLGFLACGAAEAGRGPGA